MARVSMDGLDALRYMLDGMAARLNEQARRATAEAAAQQVRDAFGPGFSPADLLPYPVQARMDGVRVRAVVYGPSTGPSRRRSAPLSRYDRLLPALPDDSL